MPPLEVPSQPQLASSSSRPNQTPLWLDINPHADRSRETPRTADCVSVRADDHLHCCRLLHATCCGFYEILLLQLDCVGFFYSCPAKSIWVIQSIVVFLFGYLDLLLCGNGLDHVVSFARPAYGLQHGRPSATRQANRTGALTQFGFRQGGRNFVGGKKTLLVADR